DCGARRKTMKDCSAVPALCSWGFVYPATQTTLLATFGKAASVAMLLFLISVAIPPSAVAAGKFKTLHTFKRAKDGAYPNSLIFDQSGNLYGTTFDGGSNRCSGSGCGTVFQLRPSGNGNWKMTTIHTFHGDGKDGYWPYAG